MNQNELYDEIYKLCSKQWHELKKTCTDCIFHYSTDTEYGCLGRDPSYYPDKTAKIIKKQRK